MSARPQLATLPPEELDLLISRALDGDLDSQEQDTFERCLEEHPEARRRKEELAALVTALKDLPAPEPPFALATRVSAQVAESSSGLGSTWHRFGIYPSPGAVVLVAGVLAAAAGLSVFLRSAAKPAATIAEKAPAKNASEEPVQVFLQERDQKQAANQPAPEAHAAGRAGRESGKLADVQAKRKDEALSKRQADDQEAQRRKSVAQGDLPAGIKAETRAELKAEKKEDERYAEESKLAESRRDAALSRFSPEMPASKAAPPAAPAAAAEQAPAPPRQAEPMAAAAKPERSREAEAKPAESAAGSGARARAETSPADATRPALDKGRLISSLRFSATLVGRAAGDFRIAKLPAQTAPDSAIDVTFRLTIQDGRVAGLKIVSVTPPDARSRTGPAEVFARGLMLEPLGAAAPVEVDVRVVAAPP